MNVWIQQVQTSVKPNSSQTSLPLSRLLNYAASAVCDLLGAARLNALT